MSDRERAIQLLNNIPDSKMFFVVNMLENVNRLLIDEIEPDSWDLKMISQAQAENDGVRATLDELLEKDGLTYADLQD